MYCKLPKLIGCLALFLISTPAIGNAQSGERFMSYNKTQTIWKDKLDNSSGNVHAFNLMLPAQGAFACEIEAPQGGISNLGYSFGAESQTEDVLNSVGFDVLTSSTVPQHPNNSRRPNNTVISGSLTDFLGRSPGVPLGLYRFFFDHDMQIDQAWSPIEVRCYQNILTGSFNTNTTPVNILELQNSSPNKARVYVHAKDSDGNVLIAAKRLDIPGGNEIHLMLHEDVGLDTFGSIMVEWVGEPNALRASLSRYAVTPNGLDLRSTRSLPQAGR